MRPQHTQTPRIQQQPSLAARLRPRAARSTTRGATPPRTAPPPSHRRSRVGVGISVGAGGGAVGVRGRLRERERLVVPEEVDFGGGEAELGVWD